MSIFFFFCDCFCFLLSFLLAIAFLTLFERKFLAAIQLRRGPVKTGFFGYGQPIADGVKLAFKEFLVPGYSFKYYFLFSPVFMFLISFFLWVIIPVFNDIFLVYSNVSLLFFFSFSSFSVYALILSGWSSNSNYCFFG